ncbi:hypothetical protein DB30_00348 [Enhygromyxa salina]|uniref:Lipoprotein n=1 Tax=Enhygromyxa salina TaxID=215803 RepID=A0A0C2CUP4_9BACT|nr:hypothetical protein [Enhygromyxa salina]KIG13300.1 hypothetical protein DB30_00348 [Enhygromyxa salina]
MPRPATALAQLLAVSLVSVTLGCAAPCTRVQDSHTAFRKATLPITSAARPSQGASDGRTHASISVPYEIIDAMVAKQLGRLPKLSVPVPAVAGVSLGSLGVGVESVRARPAPAGELGFRVTIGLSQGKRAVMTVDVDARVRPQLSPASGTLSVALSGRDVIELKPSISAQSRKQLGDWIWSQIPGPAKMMVDRGTVGALAGELADQLMGQAARLLEHDLLDDLGELARFELDLPDELPVSAISLSAGDRYLNIDLRTTLRVEHGLAGSHERRAGMHQNSIQVRVSGDAIAALANHAIREGRIPERWTLEGEPSPTGAVYAGVGWAEGTPDPLEVHLWKLDSDCAHVILRGEPHLVVVGRELELGAEQAKVHSVVGSAKVRAGLFFSKAARRGVSLIERTAASTEIEIGASTMNAQIVAAEIDGDELVLGLGLVAGPAPTERAR